MGKKIATCSYCGTRAVLVFDEGLHELTCGACGAPLHEMKFMPQSPEREAKNKSMARQSRPKPRRKAAPDHARAEWRDWPAKKRTRKRRKPIARRVLEELWDVVEDIFD